MRESIHAGKLRTSVLLHALQEPRECGSDTKASMKALLFLSASLLLADDAKAPEISKDQQLDYVSAQVEQMQANAHMEAAIQSMKQTCGERPIILNEKKLPVCR